MAKSPQQRIVEQMEKLGIGAEHFTEIQAEYDTGAFPGRSP